MVAALDVIAGASILGVGIIAWRRFRTTAILALVAALAWFAAVLVPSLALLHRPLLLHAALTLTGGGARRPLPRGLLAVAWIGIALPTGLQPAVSVATAGLCVAVAARPQWTRRAESRAHVAASRRALLLLSAGLVLPVLERMMWPRFVEGGLPVATYLCAVVLSCTALARGVLASDLEEADAVIELSDRTPAEALVELRRVATESADLRHGHALRSAITLLEDNARLQRGLADRIDEVRESRARLIGAAVDERQRLARSLAAGALTYLDELEECLRSTDALAAGDLAVARCLEEIARTREDLDQLARGLHPRTLTEKGLAAALAELSCRGPVPVEVSAPAGRFPERAEVAVWYACAEALANVWKHARATRATVSVQEAAGALWVTVRDDGVGGATLSANGGLTGLVDRLSDLGGRLGLTSSPAGTVVTIQVPVR